MKKNRPRFLKWTLRLLGVGLLLVLLLFLGSNLLLRTNWGRGQLAHQLNRRAPGIKWEVESAAWSPWNGFSLQGLTARLAQQPQAPSLLTLESASIQPYWSEALRGRKLFREFALERPVINLPIEALFVIQTSPTPAATATALPKEEKEPAAQPAPSQRPASPKNSSAKREPTGDPESPQPEPEPKTPAPDAGKSSPPSTSAPSSPQQKSPPLDPRFWFRIHDARVRLYSLSQPHSFTIEGLHLDLPLAGPPTTGSITWEKVLANSDPVSSGGRLPIAWEHPRWRLAPTALPVTLPQLQPTGQTAPVTLQTQWSGSLIVRGHGHPFDFRGYLPPQPLPEYCLQPDAEFLVSAQEISANFISSGRLTDLRSWKFDSLAALNQLEAYSRIRGQHFYFDTARSRLEFRQTVLHAPSLRLRSERFSLLGNGQLGMNGYLLGVLRIVADPEIEEKITRVANGSLMPGKHIFHWMAPLETRDRYYRDLHVEGPLPDPQINTGRHGEFIFLSQLRQLLEQFLNQELAEEPRYHPTPNP